MINKMMKVNSINGLKKIIKEQLLPNYHCKMNFDKPSFLIEIEETLIIAAQLCKKNNKIVYEFVFDTSFLGLHIITYEEIKMIHKILTTLNNNKKLIIPRFKKYTVEEYEEEQQREQYYYDHIGSIFEKSLEKTYLECVNKGNEKNS